MDRQKKIVTLAIVLAVALILILAAAAVYKYLAPSSVRRDLGSVFELKENEVALIADGRMLEARGLVMDGQNYVPADVAAEYLDERIYWDGKEKVFSYVTEEGLIQAKPEQVEYLLGKNSQTAPVPIVRMSGSKAYVSMQFVSEHSSNYFKEYKDPSRIVMMSDRKAEYTMATLAKDVRVRVGPGKKYDYLTEVPEGGRVMIQEGVKQENEYESVMTEDGVTGYIPIDTEAGRTKAPWEFEKEPVSFKQISLGKTVCLGWHQVTNEASSGTMSASVAQAGPLNVISPTWYALSDNNGSFSSIANADYVTQAHAKGLQVWGLINDFEKGLRLKKILGRTSNRTRLVNELVASAIRYDLDGINIDFENVKKETADAYLEFLRELVLKCHANDLIVSVDNYSPADYNAYYNLAEQGRIVDYVILMAYDEHYSGSEESGSVSSLGFVEKGTDDVLASVPKERTVVALPFYTRLWKEVKQKNGKMKMVPPPTVYGMSGAESVVRANGAVAEWDDKTGQYFAQYRSNGALYKIWLEEETSLKKKMEAIKKRKVAGVAFWKLGFERAVTWQTVASTMFG